MIKITKNFKISCDSEPKIIAEISGNHGGSKKRFLELIKSACLNGADLIKIQSYEPRDITLNKKKGKYLIKKGIWKNINLWDLYKKACTPLSWHDDAFNLAKKYKKIIFSSPFSLRAVDKLERLNCKIYKIASFEITDVKLIDYIASKNKPIIISTGMASNDEITKAIKQINKYHNKIIILHCVSSYPTKLKDIKLHKIKEFREKFKTNLIGLSDHTNGITSSLISLAYGTVAIEKHFKIDDKFKTADSSFSITPNQLKQLKLESSQVFESFKKKNSNSAETISLGLRRSIFAKKRIAKNSKLTTDNIETLRPYIGICASKYFKVLGKKVKRNLKVGDPIFEKYLL